MLPIPDLLDKRRRITVVIGAEMNLKLSLRLTQVAVVALVSLITASAHATVYTNRSDFNAAIAGLNVSTDSFVANTDPGYIFYGSTYQGANFTISGVNFAPSQDG